MDNLGYEDSDSEEERQSVCCESDVDIPDIDRLLINPYRWIVSRYELFITFFLLLVMTLFVMQTIVDQKIHLWQL